MGRCPSSASMRLNVKRPLKPLTSPETTDELLTSNPTSHTLQFFLLVEIPWESPVMNTSAACTRTNHRWCEELLLRTEHVSGFRVVSVVSGALLSMSRVA